MLYCVRIGWTGCLHVPARDFRTWLVVLVGPAFVSSFLIVFVSRCSPAGMLFAQRISPATTPSSDSDVRDSLKQFTNVYETIEAKTMRPGECDKAIYNGAIPSMLPPTHPHSPKFFESKSYRPPRKTARQVLRRGLTVGPRNNKVHRHRSFRRHPGAIAPASPGDNHAAMTASHRHMAPPMSADLLRDQKVPPSAKKSPLLNRRYIRASAGIRRRPRRDSALQRRLANS